MNNLDWKKIGLIALILASGFMMLFFVYYFFFRSTKDQPQPKDQTETETRQDLPQTIEIDNQQFFIDDETGDLQPIIDEDTKPTAQARGSLTKTDTIIYDPVDFISYDNDGQLIYYNRFDQKFHSLSSLGNDTIYNDNEFYNVESAAWSNDGTKAILEYPDGNNILYDFTSDEQITLPKHWTKFEFSPGDQYFAFMSLGLDPDNRFMAIAKADGSQAKILEKISGKENAFDINWSPSRQVVGTFVESKDLDRSNVYFIGQNKENFKLMVAPGRGFEGIWTPEGNEMLYSVYNAQNQYKPQLWIASASAENIGDNRRSIGLQTWAEKCAFSNNQTLYCAVPSSLPFGAGFDKSSTYEIKDNIYEINISTGSKKLIAVLEGDYSIKKIIIKDNNLYFTDNNDGSLHKISL